MDFPFKLFKTNKIFKGAKMDTKEKILLVELLLKDIEENCEKGRYGRNAEDRALKAKELCEEIASENNSVDFTILADFCEAYINSSKKLDDWNCRFFRQRFPMGYEKMKDLHNLFSVYQNKSKDFKSVAKEYITSPEIIFIDWADLECY